MTFLLALACWSEPDPEPPTGQPDVLLVVLDTTRRDAFSPGPG